MAKPEESRFVSQLWRLIATAFLAGCGANPNYSGTYAGGDTTGVVHMQIVETGDGQISGSITASVAKPIPERFVQTVHAISGVREGPHFSLIVKSNTRGGSDGPISITASGKTLSLLSPATGQTIDMIPMDNEEYREMLAALGTDGEPMDY